MANKEQELDAFDFVSDLTFEQISGAETKQPKRLQTRQPLERPTSLSQFFADSAQNVESAGRAALRGGLEGFGILADMFGGLPAKTGSELEQRQNRAQILEEMIPPTAEYEEGSAQALTEDFLQRSGKLAPLVANPASLTGTAAAVLSGAGAGTVAKELGFGQTGQDIAEGLGAIGPGIATNLFRKGIQAGSVEQEQFINRLKNQGFTDKQIAPLLASDRPLTSAVAGKATRLRSAPGSGLQEARTLRNQVFQDLQSLPQASQKASPNALRKFSKNINEKVNKLPKEIENLIRDDLNKFFASDQTNADATILWDAINTQFGKRGGKRLQPLKEEITEILQNASPEFAEQFLFANKVGQRFAKIDKVLRPTTTNEIVSAFKTAKLPFQVAYGMFTGNPFLLGEAAFELAIPKVAEKYLTSPRAQNISKKFATAVKKNSVPLMRSALSEMQKAIEKDSPDNEVSDLLQQVDAEEFLDAFSQ